MADPLSEQEIIRRTARRFAALTESSSVESGIGDDAAVLRLMWQAGGLPAEAGVLRHLVTTDTLIEGVHFDLSSMSLADVGYKALAVNLSDINAMGGENIAALGTLGVPPGAGAADVDALLDGVEAALHLCEDAGQSCALIGGDTVAAPQWIVGFTVLGQVEGAPLLRSGAKPGDMIWHSGTLGLSGIGLLQLQSGAGSPLAVAAHLRPAPPLTLGSWLQRSGYASAAQDLSDSLSQVALQLAEASGVGIELDFSSYNFAPEVAGFAKQHGKGTAELLLAQAEDYQLLFTTPPEVADAIRSAPMPCTRLGKIVEVSNGNSYVDELGNRQELTAVGFEHL